MKPSQNIKAILLMTSLLLASCTGFPFGDYIKQQTQLLHNEHPNITQFKKNNARTLSYLYQPNDNSNTLMVFVHGSPGKAEGYAYYLRHKDLLTSFSLLAVDRLGYERKNNQGPERSLQKQSDAIHNIIERHKKNNRVILIGHSFGGPVISKMALDYPQHYKHLIMIAASVDPALEKTKWFQIPANWWILRWLVPQALDTSNQEILALKNELTKMKNTLITRKNNNTLTPMNIHIIHGTNDKLVPVENVNYMKEIYQDSVKKTVLLQGANHFLPWSHPEIIMQSMYEIAQ